MHKLSALLRTVLPILLVGITAASNVQAASLATQAIINLPATDAWALFSTEAGLNTLGYTHAHVELRLGGPLQADGTAALPVLNSTIISLDAGHMLSFEPVDNAAHAQWTVLYLTAMGKDMTQLRWLSYFPDEQHAAMTQQQQQVRTLFEQLIRRYAPECEVCKLEKARLK